MEGIRKIVHVDMDAFYTSVEQLDHPELKGKPVIVGGSPQSRGVVAAASYEARKFGVRSAMSTRRAYHLCPEAVFIRPRFERYQQVSRQIRAIFLSVTDLVEPLSLDEAYLDVTENKLGEPLGCEVAAHVRARIWEELGLTASAGVGPNKFIAKVASDLRKPDGLVVVAPERVDAFVAALPVERLWGVGPATARKLHERGLFYARDLREVPQALMESWFGKFGIFLFDLAFGRDERRVRADREPKSRGSETTFSNDVMQIPLLLHTLGELAQDVAQGLEKAARRGRTVTLKVRYSDFSTITRSRTVARPLEGAGEIEREARALLEASTEAGHRPIRLVGISVSHFENPEVSPQLLLDL